jgi:hypothetical protein
MPQFIPNEGRHDFGRHVVTDRKTTSDRFTSSVSTSCSGCPTPSHQSLPSIRHSKARPSRPPIFHLIGGTASSRVGRGFRKNRPSRPALSYVCGYFGKKWQQDDRVLRESQEKRGQGKAREGRPAPRAAASAAGRGPKGSRSRPPPGLASEEPSSPGLGTRARLSPFSGPASTDVRRFVAASRPGDSGLSAPELRAALLRGARPESAPEPASGADEGRVLFAEAKLRPLPGARAIIATVTAAPTAEFRSLSFAGDGFQRVPEGISRSNYWSSDRNSRWNVGVCHKCKIYERFLPCCLPKGGDAWPHPVGFHS